jgi:methyltransferase (TIGR00027 family)
MAAGIRQYVIVGAGLDSFGLRHPELAGSLNVFELDHPASQESKRHRVIELTGEMPKNIVFVPVDFEKETVADALRRSSFAPTEQAFFSWLGTTHYLSAESVYATLGAISHFAVEGSEVVFDYGVRGDLLADTDRKELDVLKRFVAKRGEPLVSSFDPEIFATKIFELGFTLIEDLSYEQQKSRYFANRTDDLRPAAFSRIAHYRI